MRTSSATLRDDTGTNKALSPLGKAVSKEGERDWTEVVQKILKKFNR